MTQGYVHFLLWKNTNNYGKKVMTVPWYRIWLNPEASRPMWIPPYVRTLCILFQWMSMALKFWHSSALPRCVLHNWIACCPWCQTRYWVNIHERNFKLWRWRSQIKWWRDGIVTLVENDNKLICTANILVIWVTNIQGVSFTTANELQIVTIIGTAKSVARKWACNKLVHWHCQTFPRWDGKKKL